MVFYWKLKQNTKEHLPHTNKFSIVTLRAQTQIVHPKSIQKMLEPTLLFKYRHIKNVYFKLQKHFSELDAGSIRLTRVLRNIQKTKIYYIIKIKICNINIQYKQHVALI